MSSQKQNASLDSILNESNKLITTDYITNLLKEYGIDMHVKNLNLYQEAMIHLSYLIRNDEFYKNNKTKPYHGQIMDVEPIKDKHNVIPLQKKSYERLEYLGDSVLRNIIAGYLYKRYPNEDEGFLTKLRTKLENGTALSLLSKRIGLHDYVLISKHVEKNGGRTSNDKVLEDVFEAFIGALYLDMGFDISNKFVVRLMEKEIHFAQLLHKETNFKEKLLQYFHHMKYEDPIYGSLRCTGSENKKVYTMYVKCKKNVHDPGTIIGEGYGSSKKIGEQMAAKNAMVKLNIYNEDSCDSDEEIEEYDSEYDLD